MGILSHEWDFLLALREIKLTQGKVALVDDSDYERLSAFSWQAYPGRKSWYAVRQLGEGRTLRMHHDVIGKPPPGMVTDHIDDNGLNNQRANLRFISYSENTRRSFKSRNVGVSKKTYPKDRPWKAQVAINRKNVHVGYFATEDEAIEARAEFLANHLREVQESGS